LQINDIIRISVQIEELVADCSTNKVSDVFANSVLLNSTNDVPVPPNPRIAWTIWGTGKKAAADGSKFEIYENNLNSEYHIRYGGYGGIAYHLVSDKYIALFTHFITCGVWEGIYFLDKGFEPLFPF
jgi:Tn3 transposase DDE domain